MEWMHALAEYLASIQPVNFASVHSRELDLDSTRIQINSQCLLSLCVFKRSWGFSKILFKYSVEEGRNRNIGNETEFQNTRNILTKPTDIKAWSSQLVDQSTVSQLH